jgi:hypothetical protein
MTTFTILAPTDAQLSYIAGLCDERGLEAPQVVASKQEASEIIGRKRLTPTEGDWHG